MFFAIELPLNFKGRSLLVEVSSLLTLLTMDLIVISTNLKIFNNTPYPERAKFGANKTATQPSDHPFGTSQPRPSNHRQNSNGGSYGNDEKKARVCSGKPSGKIVPKVKMMQLYNRVRT